MFQAIGDSMIEAGIVDGDLLFVIPTRELRDAAKHIVVCRVGGTTLVTELELHAGRIASRSKRATCRSLCGRGRSPADRHRGWTTRQCASERDGESVQQRTSMLLNQE